MTDLMDIPGREPTGDDAYRDAAEALRRGELHEAGRIAAGAVRSFPNHVGLLFILGATAIRTGKAEDGLRVMRRLLEFQPGDAAATIEAANAQRTLGDVDGAIATLDSLLASQPEFLPALNAKAGTLAGARRFDEAHALLAPVIASNPEPASALMFAGVCRSLDRVGEGINALEPLVLAEAMPASQSGAASYELARLYDRAGRFDEAFSRATVANGALAAAEGSTTEQITADWSAWRLASMPVASASEERPVLIVGLPGSGVELLESALAEHGQVTALGESPASQLVSTELENLARADGLAPPASVPTRDLMQSEIDHLAQLFLGPFRSSGAPCTVDRHLGLIELLGLVSRIAPHARVLACHRDLRDACIATFFRNSTAAYSRDLAMCARQTQVVSELIAYWKDATELAIHDVEFEALMQDPAGTINGVLGFLELPSEDRCADFLARPEHIAMRESIGSWKNYESHLGSLAQTLGEA